MASPYHLAIPGKFVVVGKQPDGDSVRFVAENAAQYRDLRNGHRARVSSDGSVQLRFEAIDAPEVHYGTAAQPLGPEARAAALQWLGFRNVRFADDGITVTSARPASVPGLIMSKAVEINGRPVSYVLRAEDAPVRGRGWKTVDRRVLAATLNQHLIQTGDVYPTFYTSTPRQHRQILRALAVEARIEGAGVWALDSTWQFVLEDQRSIGPEGALILPKLFRRATDYLKDRADGFAGTFPEWILDASTTPYRDENDGVVVDERLEVHLADLVQQRNRRIQFQADPLDIVFVEK